MGVGVDSWLEEEFSTRRKHVKLFCDVFFDPMLKGFNLGWPDIILP